MYRLVESRSVSCSGMPHRAPRMSSRGDCAGGLCGEQVQRRRSRSQAAAGTSAASNTKSPLELHADRLTARRIGCPLVNRAAGRGEQTGVAGIAIDESEGCREDGFLSPDTGTICVSGSTTTPGSAVDVPRHRASELTLRPATVGYCDIWGTASRERLLDEFRGRFLAGIADGESISRSPASRAGRWPAPRRSGTPRA